MKLWAQAAIAAILIGGTSTASATDLALKDPPPEFEITPATVWAGPYVGVHGGHSRGSAQITDTYAYNSTDPIKDSEIASNSLIGGVQLGYNRQTGHLVYGIEGDIGRMNISGRTSAHLQDRNLAITGPLGHPYELDANYSTSGGLYGDLTGRLGYTSNNTMFFLKGGAAFLNMDARASYIGGSWVGPHTFNYDASDTMLGWTMGFGMEYALSPSLRLKALYQHFDFGSISFAHNEVYKKPGGPTSTLSGNDVIDVTADAVTIGMTYDLSGVLR
jgi:outer membrane immunogenic protein